MRFRANTSFLPWLLVGYTCVYAFDVFRSRSVYPFWQVNFFSVTILSVLLFFLSHFLIYWDMDSTSLREHKLWKKKEIAWHDVTCISWLGFSSVKVKISYGLVPGLCVHNCQSIKYQQVYLRSAPVCSRGIH